MSGTIPPSRLRRSIAHGPQLRGRRFLLFLARIHEKKGCDLLIEAFARVAEMAPEVDLVMAGPDQVGMQAKTGEPRGATWHRRQGALARA